MKALAWYLLSITLLFGFAWVEYLAAMNLKRVRKEERALLSDAAIREGFHPGLPWQTKVFAVPFVLIPGYGADIAFHYLVGTILFLDFRWGEHTLSERLQRYVYAPRYKDTWRQKIAIWLAVYMLEPFDPGHIFKERRRARFAHIT